METDFLVIGSGIGGLSAALKLAKKGTVAIITKKHKSESNTNYAQGGIASVFDKGDTYELHIQDTLTAGAGLCHEDAVRLIVEQGPRRLPELMAMVVDGKLDPVIGEVASLANAAQALGRMGRGEIAGKLVVVPRSEARSP